MIANSSVEIVLPIFSGNIAQVEGSTIKLLDHLKKIKGPYSFTVTLSINGREVTELLTVVTAICENNRNVSYSLTEKQGKGHGVISAWEVSAADILVYMDIDLATSLDSFEQLLCEVKNGGGISIGSRYLSTSTLERSLKRYALSRVYHSVLIRGLLRLPVKDVQCGFKAMEQSVFFEIRPYLKSYDFFFDAELVYTCFKMNKRIIEIPVHWAETKLSSVKLFRTSVSFFISALLLRAKYSRFKKL